MKRVRISELNAHLSAYIAAARRDAIHLATAMLLRETRYPDLVFATHDRRLGMAARLAEFTVVGVD